MANKPVTLKKKNGEVYLPKTSIAQVIGLTNELAGKQPNLTQEQLDAVNSGITSGLTGKITTNETAISGINTKIPAQATSSNQLADKGFVNSSINAMAADFIAYDSNNSNFPTKAALLSSTKWYRSGAEYVPQKNDYLVVLADESNSGKQTRYLVVEDFTANVAPVETKVQLQYVINDAPFTSDQNAAINSGITSQRVASYDALVAGNGALLSKTEAGETYATIESFNALGGTVRYVGPGADLSAFGDDDLIVEFEE